MPRSLPVNMNYYTSVCFGDREIAVMYLEAESMDHVLESDELDYMREVCLEDVEDPRWYIFPGKFPIVQIKSIYS